MKNHILYVVILMVSFSGCLTHKQTTQSNETESTIKLNCKNNDVPTTIFSGKVIDIKTKEAIAFANVILTNKSNGKELGVITNSEGNFTIKDIPLGAYNLNVNNEGYDRIDMHLNLDKYSICEADIKLLYHPIRTEKPVIYLYPEHRQEIKVQLTYAGNLTHTYPKYPGSGWKVIAEPNGTLWDENGMEYYALFWEGTPHKPLIADDGFVIAGKETAEFLEEKLAYLGLNRREANEFIMYWLPRMEGNAYNLIHFSGEDYETLAKLNITPHPETIIRVMMLTRPLTNKIDVPLQDLKPLHKTRKGFTVVEWGGSVIHLSTI